MRWLIRAARLLSAAFLVSTLLPPVGADASPRPAVGDLAPYLSLVQVASGLQQPLFATHAGDGSGRLFIIERAGRVRILAESVLAPTAFLDIRSKVGSGSSEQGLLGLAFHPNFPSNGRFYVYYTDLSGRIVIAGYAVSSNPDVADATSETILLTIPKPAANHNGGMLAFGPDGYLYAGTGDGGGAGDPNNNGQSLATLLGKILRLDVDGGAPYAIPPGNPYAGSTDPAVRKEIWAFGLRNPWRFSFDRQAGDLYIADVGQGAREEINFQRAASAGGENYGWRVMEGSLCFNPSSGCDRSGLTLPVAEYDHGPNGGCSVTGGYVYRGAEFPELAGVYLFGDFCTGRLWGLEATGGGAWSSALLIDTPFTISSFGEDQAGEIYLTDFNGGRVFRLVALAFADVPYSHWARSDIEALYDAGYVAGCSTAPRLYCPDRILSRAESAVFILRGSHGAILSPPAPPPATPSFADVDPGFWGFGWIESLYSEGFTAGCGTNPLIYCPLRDHNRAEGSVFFLRIKHGVTYTPPAPTGTFNDVDPAAWYAAWVEAAHSEGLLPACNTSPLRFCPEAPLDRSWAAYMMVRSKNLPVP